MATDLYWTSDGDFARSPDGDLKDTSFDALRSLAQEVRTRVRSDTQDWAMYPGLGSDIHELIGNPNNRFTAEEGKSRIIASLSRGGFIPRNSIKVRYLPLGRYRILYDVGITVNDPSGKSRLLKTILIYDTLESSVTVV